MVVLESLLPWGFHHGPGKAQSCSDEQPRRPAAAVAFRAGGKCYQGGSEEPVPGLRPPSPIGLIAKSVLRHASASVRSAGPGYVAAWG